ncbi:YdgA family protein [Budvicia diplopodorum]|uniref:YdgA family protein n=1 Tax=Budvicia diplopodorum TaxID=1119056 RepID=UPI00135A9799|nr:YdgA family protein [Budvicia diplopodorum]
MAMKKSIVAVGVLAVLGGAWVGASWYTGKLIETQINQGLIEAKVQVNKYFPTANSNLTIAKYQRGIFSSQIAYTVEVSVDPAAKVATDPVEVNADPATKEYVTINQNVSHGPFPLEKLSLVPKLAYSTIELVNTESIKPLFDMSKGQSPLTVNALSSYDGSTAVKLVVAPMEDKTAQDPASALKFNGLTFDGTIVVEKDKNRFNFVSTPIELTESGSSLNVNKMNLEGSIDNTTHVIDSTLDIGDVVMNAVDEEKHQERYTFKDIALNGSVKNGKFDMNVGLANFKMKSFVQEVNGQSTLSVSDLTISSDVKEDDKNIDQTLNTTVGNLTVANHNLGSGHMLLKMNQFDGNALRYINKNSNQISALLLNSAMGNSSASALDDNQLMTQLMTFLEGNPTIAISPLIWKNAKGESQLDMSLTLKRPESMNFTDIGQLAAQLIKQFSSTTHLSVPMIAEQAKMNSQAFDGMSAEEAQAAADMTVKDLIAMGTEMKTLTVQGDELTSSFNYADGIIDLNGQKMPVEQFLQSLGMSGE